MNTFVKSPQGASKALFIPLKRAMKQGDEQVRRNVLQAISLLHLTHAQEMLPFIELAVQDKAPEVREAAVYALSKIDNINSHKILRRFGLKLVEDPSPFVREALAWTLGQRNLCEIGIAMTLLITLLNDRVEAVSLQAMQSLCNRQNGALKNKIMSLKHDYTSSSLSKKKKILTIFGAWGLGFSKIKDALKDHDLRYEAVEALGNLGQKLFIQVVEILFQFVDFNGPQDPFVREKVIPTLIHLGKQNSKPMRTYIAKIANTGMNPEAAPYLIQILGEIGEDDIDKTFEIIQEITSRTNNNQQIQKATIVAIGCFCRHEPNQGFPYLKTYLKSPHEMIRIVSMQVLSQFAADLQNDFESFFNLFLPMLNEPSVNIRKATIEALGAIGVYHFKEIHSLLNDTIRLETNPDVRAAIVHAIIKASSGTPTHLINLLWLMDQQKTEVLNDGEENTIYETILESLGQAIQSNLSSDSFALIENSFHDWLYQSSASIKSKAIKILPKWKRPSQEIVEMLEIHLEDKQLKVRKTAIQALAELPVGIQLQSYSIEVLKNALTTTSFNKEEIFNLLCRIDLSSYPDLMLFLIKSQGPNALKGTSLASLVKQASASYRAYSSVNYLFAMVYKCLASNQELFVHKGEFCIWEEGRLEKLVKAKNFDLQNAKKLYWNNSFELSGQQALKTKAYAQAGHYYRKAGVLYKMMECYKEGHERLEEIKGLMVKSPSQKFPELTECLEATCYLGICYQTGLELVEDRLSKAANCYIHGSSFNHPLSLYLYSLCCEFGLGIKKDLTLARQLFSKLNPSFQPPILFHIFHLSAHAYMLDAGRNIPPLGTIGMAISSLEPTAIDLNTIIYCMDQRVRPDYKLVSARVEYNPTNGDLVILLPEILAQNKALLDKCLQLGLVGEEVNELRQCGNEKRKHTIRFIVPEAEIERFLRNELYLNEAVYFELRDIKKKS
ncbi:MAG: HEAT repeat domain-containing protein [Parachlamydiaceae bacterium]|nr:HEAT repeat domain-containing protein [Parachlamydiaceae bacterium]